MVRKIKKIVLRGYHSVKSRFSRIAVFNILWKYNNKICRGQRVYDNLLEKYGNDVQIYVEHYPGTGDVYITCALLEAWRRKERITGPYVVTVIGKGAVKIAKLLAIENVELLSQEDTDCLVAFLRFMGDVSVHNLRILHYSPMIMYTSILDMLAGYNDLDFMTMYLSVVFKGVSWNDAVDFPAVEDTDVDEYFDEKGLIAGQTVVLFPHANTIQDIPEQYWEKLARRLREQGFTVCTNVEPGYPPILGTCDVFVPYKHIKRFVEKAGYIVGIRSGIFDIIADTDCKKFILYPTPNYFKFGVDTIHRYFSVHKMGIGEKCWEYEFERIYDKSAFMVVYRDILKAVEMTESYIENYEDIERHHVHCVIPH